MTAPVRPAPAGRRYWRAIALWALGALGLCLVLLKPWPQSARAWVMDAGEAWQGVAATLGLDLAPDLRGGGGPSFARRGALVLAFGLMTLGYGLALRRLRDERAPAVGLGSLVQATALASVALGLTPHLFSEDLFSYVTYARMAALHGGNPFVDVPADFPDDPYLPFVFWRETSSVYGPAWLYPALALAWLCEQLPRGALWAAAPIVGFRVLAALAHLASGALLHRLLLARGPRAAAFGAGLYLLNPLVVVQFAQDGHNDSWMILALLAAACAHRAGRTTLAAMLLTAGAMVKWVALAPLGLYFVALLRQAGPRAAVLRAAAASVALAAACYAPWWDGGEALRKLGETPAQNMAANSFAVVVARELAIVRHEWAGGPDSRWGEAVLRARGEPTAGTDLVARGTVFLELRDEGVRFRKRVTSAWRWASGLVLLALAALAIARTRDFEDVVSQGGSFLLAWVLLSAWFWPWYATWPLALGALAGPGRLRSSALLLCLLTPLMHVLSVGDPMPVYLRELGSFQGGLFPAQFRWVPVFVLLPPLLLAVAPARALAALRARLGEGTASGSA